MPGDWEYKQIIRGFCVSFFFSISVLQSSISRQILAETDGLNLNLTMND